MNSVALGLIKLNEKFLDKLEKEISLAVRAKSLDITHAMVMFLLVTFKKAPLKKHLHFVKPVTCLKSTNAILIL